MYKASTENFVKHKQQSIKDDFIVNLCLQFFCKSSQSNFFLIGFGQLRFDQSYFIYYYKKIVMHCRAQVNAIM